MVIAGVCTICEAYPLVLDDNKNTHLTTKCTTRDVFKTGKGVFDKFRARNQSKHLGFFQLC